MLAYLRRNAIALLALFVALGGTSFAAVIVTSNSQVGPDTISGHKPPTGAHSNIISGSLTTTDLADGGVTNNKLQKASVSNGKLAANAVDGTKVADNSLTGADVNESTLGRVPDAARLGGVDAADFRPGSAMASQRTDACAQVGTWQLCAPVSITVPSGTYYKVSVNTSMTAWGVTAGTGGLFCAASEGPSCINGHPSGFTLIPNQYTNVAHNGSAYFGAGTHTFGMAARFDIAPGANIETAYTTTTIRWHRYNAEFAAPAP
jgi:hypothetical protein